MHNQFHFPFKEPDDNTLFRPIFLALEANKCWGAMARLFTICKLWEQLQRHHHVAARLEQRKVVRQARETGDGVNPEEAVPLMPDPSTASEPRSGRGPARRPTPRR